MSASIKFVDNVRVNFVGLRNNLDLLADHLDSDITSGDTTTLLYGVNTRIVSLDDSLDALKFLEGVLRAERKRLAAVRDFIGDEQFKVSSVVK